MSDSLEDSPKIRDRPSRRSLLIGWQEWCALPQLNIPAIKAKIDTGAKTSSLHAEQIRASKRQGEWWVEFILYPLQKSQQVARMAQARILDQRQVTNSGGSHEKRYVIASQLILSDRLWEIELTLTNRASMAFRMLLGRQALSGHTLIDCKRMLNQGKLSPKELHSLYELDS